MFYQSTSCNVKSFNIATIHHNLIPDINHIRLDRWLAHKGNSIQLSVLRTDLIHPVISGNKWFKLQYYLADAINQGFKTVASFGGAYSNHIVALAAAAKLSGLKSIGIIRGEGGTSPTLQEAQQWDMKLIPVSREAYRDRKNIIDSIPDHENIYWVDEGGYGILGAKGASAILSVTDCSAFSHILCACGTGTMIAGLIMGSSLYQKIIGISVLKNNRQLEESIAGLLPETMHNHIVCIHDYHFSLTKEEEVKRKIESEWRRRIKVANPETLDLSDEVLNKYTYLKSDRKKAFIVGWYGTETVGDKAILAGIILDLKKKHGNGIQIIVGSLFPYITNHTLLELDS